jgi:hypothetical protein
MPIRPKIKNRPPGVDCRAFGWCVRCDLPTGHRTHQSVPSHKEGHMPGHKKLRNLHTSISPLALQLARTKAAIEARTVSDIIDSAIHLYCEPLAQALADLPDNSATGTSGTGGAQ